MNDHDDGIYSRYDYTFCKGRCGQLLDPSQGALCDVCCETKLAKIQESRDGAPPLPAATSNRP